MARRYASKSLREEIKRQLRGFPREAKHQLRGFGREAARQAGSGWGDEELGISPVSPCYWDLSPIPPIPISWPVRIAVDGCG